MVPMMTHSCFAPPPQYPLFLPSPTLPPPPRSTSFLCPTASTHKPKFGIVISNASSSSSSSASTSKQQQGAEDKDRYQRVELETAGAYRLIDRRTGNQVIVWGDTHDLSDTSDPSHLLHSQPSSKATGTTTPSEGRPPRGPSSVASTGFARLKAQKVKSLMMRKHTSTSSPQSRQSRQSPQSQQPWRSPQSQESRRFSQAQQSQIQVKSSRVKKPSHPITEDRNNDYKQKNEYEPPNSDEDDSYDDSPIINDRKSRVSSSGEAEASVLSINVAKERVMEREKGGAASYLRGWGGVSSSDFSDPYSYDYKKLPRKSFAKDRGGFFSKNSFKNLGYSDPMITTLRSLEFIRPSHIQAMAFRSVLQGKSCIIADQSGSGKTLAYLCPIIQRLRQDEETALAQGKPPNSEHNSGCPRVIVLAPTAELASQVLNNCRLISKSGIPFRSMVATGGFRQKTQLETLDQGLDVLIATPGRFLYLYQQGFVQLSHLQCVVLDEVDILYGEEGFEQVLQSLIAAAPMSVQYLFVTATLPLEIYNKVVEVFPDCEVVMGPGVHRTSSALEEVLVDCSGDPDAEKNPETAFTNKKNALLKLVQESSVRKTIVFCNKIETCRKVENVLKRVDRKEARIRVLSFHGALAQEARLANLKEFLKSQSADSMFLVCTDRASRGIDFKEVDHVVLFDFPREPSEYVRRVGRTARGAGGVGQAYVFAVGKQVSLAGRIIERNRKGHPLHDVPGAYELDR